MKDGEYPISELDRWEYMYSSQGKYNEQELQRQIDALEKILTGKKSAPKAVDANDAVPLSFALARDLVLRIQLQERLRLQQSVQSQQKKGTPITILRPDPRNPEQVVPVDIASDEALEKVEDLDWRIRGTLYQQFWINLLIEEVQRYEAAIARSSVLQSLPRDAELEHVVRTQLTQLKPLLEQLLLCARVRRLRNAQAPDAEIREILSHLPKEAGKDLDAYMSKLDTQIQQVLSVTVGFPLHRKEWLGLKKVERTIPVSPVFRLRSELMQRHIDALLKREDELSGKMDSASSTEKKSLANEHQELIGDYLEFNAIHLRKFRQLLHLFIEPGPLFDAEEGSGKPAHEFPPTGAIKTDLLQQRGRELAALDTYLEHIDKSVLSNKVLEIDKLFEDILMTVAVPAGVDAIFNETEKATFVWEFHDAPWRVATGNVLGKWTPQIRPWRRKQILAPLYKHFRLPPTTQWDTPSNEEPRYYHELSPAEQAQWLKRSDVQERVESVRSIVRNFRARLQPEMTVMRGSNAILKDLLTTQTPPSIDASEKRPMKEILQKQKKLPGQLFAQESGEIIEPASDWPGNRTSEQVLQDILAADTAQARGMYFVLIERATGGSGVFEKEYGEYIRGINANLKFHIDAKDLHNYAAANFWQEFVLFLATIGVEGYVALRLAKYGARKAAGAAWQSTKWGARQVKNGADALGEESGLRSRPKPAAKPSVKPSVPSEPAASPKPAPDPAGFEQRLSQAMEEAEKPLAKPSAAPEAAKPTAPRGLNALRNSRVAEELTKMRYLRGERAIAQWMQETAIGRKFAQLKAFGNLRGVRIAGRGLTVAAWAAIPALAYVEIKQNEERVAGAKLNPELAETYRSQNDTTLLEAGGAAAAMLAEGFLPTAVLGGFVIYAADYNKERSEIVAGWQRTADDWSRENDSASLRQHMLDRTVSQAVEAGGGGAFKPRISLPSAQDQREAFEVVQNATFATRAQVFESYFRSNTFAKGSALEESVREKMTFMQMTSQGEFNATLNQEFLLADAYSTLLQRGRALKKAGESLVLSYEDAQGERKIMDLGPLLSGKASATEVRKVVSEYVFHMQSSEEIILFNTMGEIGHEKPIAVRRVLLAKLIHEIHNTERSIHAVDWPGWGRTGGEGKSRMLVRWYVVSRLNRELDAASESLLKGDWSVKQYDECMARCKGILQEVQTMEQSGADSGKYAKQAEAFFVEFGGEENVQLARRYDPKKNPLYELFRVEEEEKK